MQETAVIRRGLEGVAKRMSEVQDLPQPGLFLIARNHDSFRSDTPADDPVQRLCTAAQNDGHTALEVFEQIDVADDAIFDDFIKRRTILASRERSQQLRIGDHKLRRIERADQVLPLR